MKSLTLSRGSLKLCIAAVCLLVSGPAFSQQLIFADGFESGDLSHKQNGVLWYANTRTSVSTDIARTGRYSLRFLYEAKPAGEDSWAEQRFDLGEVRKDVYIRWFQYFPDGTEGNLGAKWTHRNDSGTLNNKFYRLWGNVPRTSSSNAIMGGGASFWPMAGGASRINADYFITYNGVTTRGMGEVGDSFSEFNDAYLGRWVEFQIHQKAASSKVAADGVIEMWIDGGRVYRTTTLDIFPGDGYQNGYTAGYLMGWANSGFDLNTYSYIDDVSFSRSKISSELYRAPPMAPDVDVILEEIQ